MRDWILLVIVRNKASIWYLRRINFSLSAHISLLNQLIFLGRTKNGSRFISLNSNLTFVDEFSALHWLYLCAFILLFSKLLYELSLDAAVFGDFCGGSFDFIDMLFHQTCHSLQFLLTLVSNLYLILCFLFSIAIVIALFARTKNNNIGFGYAKSVHFLHLRDSFAKNSLH